MKFWQAGSYNNRLWSWKLYVECKLEKVSTSSAFEKKTDIRSFLSFQGEILFSGELSPGYTIKRLVQQSGSGKCLIF